MDSRGACTHGHTEGPDGLLFVDVPPDVTLQGLRNLPFGLFQNASTVLVRADNPIVAPHRGRRRLIRSRVGRAEWARRKQAQRRLEELGLQIDLLGAKARWGLLHQPVGGVPWIDGPLTPWPDSDLLDRARAIELEALLTWGQAIWKPTRYHYLLPSGEHAAGFVRVGDAVGTPRDAEVIASWMHDRLGDGVGIVVDTGTLSAVVQALLVAVHSQRTWQPATVRVLDGYPATQFDVHNAVADAAKSGNVLALLSVNSSGRVRDCMIQALEIAGSGQGRASLEVLVDKRWVPAHDQARGKVQSRTWHPRPLQPPLVTYDAVGADVCELCRSSKTARLIPVSPRSFDGSLPASLVKVVPDIRDAGRNRRLWELCNDGHAIKLETPSNAGLRWRAPGPMPVLVDMEALLQTDHFGVAAADALHEELRRNHTETVNADLVLMSQHEFDLEGRRRLIKDLQPILGKPRVIGVQLDGTWSQDVAQNVRDAKRIAVLAIGSVTGTSLHAAVAGVQTIRVGRPDYDLRGYVLHARLSRRRSWQALENSYARRVFAAWHSYLPDRSPLREEAEALDHAGTTQEAGAAFLEQRRKYIAASGVSATPLFWGAAPNDVVSPNSVFGQGLGDRAVFVAVGSAVHRARVDDLVDGAGQRVFEMSAIMRSYYDPLIRASILRWVRPDEAWWGEQRSDGAAAVGEILTSSQQTARRILIPELLLAAAQGKLGTAAHPPLIEAAKAELCTVDDNQRGAIELGLALLPPPELSDDRDKRQRSALEQIKAIDTQAKFVEVIPKVVRGRRASLRGDILDAIDHKADQLTEK